MSIFTLSPSIQFETNLELWLVLNYQGKKESSIEIVLSERKKWKLIKFLEKSIESLITQKIWDWKIFEDKDTLILWCNCVWGLFSHSIYIFKDIDDKEILIQVNFSECTKKDWILLWRNQIIALLTFLID